ncbi:MupA/Atu3671 family FMN-dependent luciferase-like monooxygenase [Mucilaginibacter lappiensis]|uniref:Natural product biosynthesis luciferase-like monooxygenase protein n=1 Tax=Mucilaginibacter lappiensis TaxID=354630 RepID=A0A841JKZ9_9SPHI|nr:MupA/Atu3671 family FMN-dependent luciferase-like monooxygenase [Mucilaginibacter lappiensis]MBB6131863.1 natural product biosynthesis luciferase-like monooxygenase protein [Mucilaginibacter lappiensis]
MSISTNKKFKNIFVKAGNVFTKSELISIANRVINVLITRRIEKEDVVLAFISDEQYLIPAILAFNAFKVNCTIINPDNQNLDVKSIINTNHPKLIFTERQYASKFNGAEIVIVCEDDNEGELPPLAEFFQQLGKITVYDDTIQTLNIKEIETFFNKLDSLLKKDNEIFRLSSDIPYLNYVLEILWAISRGITVVLDDLSDDARLYDYTILKNNNILDFGLFFFGSDDTSQSSDKYSLLFESIKYADLNNFSAVWTPERHFNEFGGLYPNPSILGAAIAMITDRVSIRSGSLVSPLHHSVRIAEDLSLIDNLSKGRAGVSFASGWQCDDFIFFPENYSNRHEIMLEQIQTVKKLWQGEKISIKNGLLQNIEVEIFPKPIQTSLPVWVTVSGKIETFIDAGKIGANILTHLLWQDTNELMIKISAYRQALKDSGFNPLSRQVSVMAHTFLGEDNDEVKNAVRGPLKKYILSSTNLIQSMVKSNIESDKSKDIAGRYGSENTTISDSQLDQLAEIAFDRFFDHASLMGTIQKAALMIEKLKSYDIDEIACLIDFGMSQHEVLKSLTYLNTLKNKYEEFRSPRFPVTISHCTENEIIKFLQKQELKEYLKNQTLIVSDFHTDILKSLNLDVKKMDLRKNINEQNLESIANNNSLEQSFVAEISNDF